MAQHADAARRWLQHMKLLRYRARSCFHFNHVLLSNVSPSHYRNYTISTLPGSSSSKHESLVTSVPNQQALQRIRWLLKQPQRRVLLLTGSSASESSVRAELERELPAFELERRGHGIFGVSEFCQLLLRESGRNRRVFGRAQLMALILHNDLVLQPGPSRLDAASTLQRRKGAQDLLHLFQLLEKQGVLADQYLALAATAEDGDQVLAQKLAETYRKYHELLLQHGATSWEGLVLEMMTMCGVNKGDTVVENALAKEFARTVLQDYTDVVADDVQRMTPAMAMLVGHLCGQPSVQYSASFSRVLLEEEDCSRMQILERQLVLAAADTGRERTLKRTELDANREISEKSAQMRAFARQLLTKRAGVSCDVQSPVPFECWRFSTAETEVRTVSAYLARKTESMNATVLCPTHADARRIVLAFQKQGLLARIDGESSSVPSSSTGTPVHLFDEPGVNAVYSLLCALCFPSDSRYLYNVLRSNFFAFPAELLSWLMQQEHQSHTDLFSVLEAFVESHGKSLGTSPEGQEKELPKAVSCQRKISLEIAESFVNIIVHLRTKCHQLSAAEVVQSFLEATGRLEVLLSPSSWEEERESLVLADFLRELETAQKVTMSDQIPFVVPYLQQLRKANLTSSASWTGSPDVNVDARIRVIPLTAYALQSCASSQPDGEEGRKHVLVLMSMRDSKFPGRMKRLTLPLPYGLLSEPFPVQTRVEHLEQCKQLAYEALTLRTYDEVVLSFTELSDTAVSKREVVSRTFQPIWHEGNRPAPVIDRTSDSNGSASVSGAASPSDGTSVEALAASKSVATANATPQQPKTSSDWISDVAGLLRDFVARLFFPNTPPGLLQSAVDKFTRRKSGDDDLDRCHPDQDEPFVIQSTTSRSDLDCERPARSLSTDTRLSSELAPSKSYDPPHLSYSQISEYMRCPHRYYLSRVVKLNGDVTTPMMFGRALHEGIAAFAKALAVAQLNGKDPHEVKTLAALEAEEAFTQSWPGDGHGLFSSKEQSSFLFDRGVMALRDFIEMHHSDTQLEEILYVERAFSFYVPEANVELRGVWDRIDRVSSPNDDESSLHVVKEFKSNMSGTRRNMSKLADESLQLKMYMYAFHKVFGEAPYGAKLEQIGGTYSQQPNSIVSKSRKEENGRAGAHNNGFVLFSKEAAQEAKDAVVEVASGLRRGEFTPKPSYAECAFCPYAESACHFATDDASHERQSARRTRLEVEG
uniref:PD-(D/E)XK endonuclease-like domain-containing protein n=1 Tax=Peronospora matthiolae TaxID=2874970 RepID=A0AAV1VFN1_9STRA